MLERPRRNNRRNSSPAQRYARRLRFEGLEDRRVLATLTVGTSSENATSDPVDNGVLTLREAIDYVNRTFTAQAQDSQRIDTSNNQSLGVNDKIVFDASLDGATIFLSAAAGGELKITKSVQIDAHSLSSRITISAHNADPTTDPGDGIRIFNIADESPFQINPPVVKLTGLNLTGGDTPGDGGAIKSAGELELQNCQIFGNFATNGGSGISVAEDSNGSTARHPLTIVNSAIHNNDNGGIQIQAGGLSGHVVTINNSHIDHNDGGGMGVSAASLNLSIQASTISDNMHGSGLRTALAGDSHVEIDSSTISGNSGVNNGGGIRFEASSIGSNTATLWIMRSKISDNHITGDVDGGGLFAEVEHDPSQPVSKRLAVKIVQSVISGNTADHRGGGAFIHNLYYTDTLIQDTQITGNSDIDSSPSSPEISDRRKGGGLYAYIKDDHQSDPNKCKFTITGSTIDNNTTDQMGGGVFVCIKGHGDFVMTNSTISTNRTLANNGSGGGIFLAHVPEPGESIDAYLRNLTITKNVSISGGGMATAALPLVRVRLDNSIVDGNFNVENPSTRVKSNLAGPLVVSETFNGAPATRSFNNLVGEDSTILDPNNLSTPISHATLISSHSWKFDASNDPGLSPLQNNGGTLAGVPGNDAESVPTHALLSGSAALNAGSNDWATTPLTGADPADPSDDVALLTDQRGSGFARRLPSNGTVDIGAYEANNLLKVVGIKLNGVQPGGSTPWANPISFTSLVTLKQQLAPIYRYGTTRIEITFSEPVSYSPSEALNAFRLVKSGTIRSGDVGYASFSVTTNSNVVTLVFASPLPADRYRLDINSNLVVGASGHLDGEWSDVKDPIMKTRYDNNSLYNWRDDSERYFPSGDGTPGGDFQFKFALLPGDYDQNGVVDNPDYDIWRKGANHVDGDGDGQVDQAGDYTAWRNALAQVLWLQKSQGDYDKNGIVDIRDYTKWRTQFGNSLTNGQPLDADGDGNNIVDEDDYINWRTWDVTVSAWYRDPQGTAAGTLLVDSTTAPRVTDVTISGSNSAHVPYSFADHSGEQLRTVPVGDADALSITFSEDVNVDASFLRVVGFFTAQLPTIEGFYYDATSTTATWYFRDWNPNDIYIISLSDAVTDRQGYRLDGEWTNPGIIGATDGVSHFPSGDGHAGGTFNFLVTLFAGDANLDNIADDADYEIWQNYLGEEYGGFAHGDFNGDGVVGLDDVALWELANGHNLQGGAGLPGDLATHNGPGDVDWRVDDADLAVIANNFGMSSPGIGDGDLNGDGHVDMADIDLAMAHYGLELSVVI